MSENRSSRRQLVALLLVAGAALHGLQLAGGWQQVTSSRHGRDFASYFYAVRAAWNGTNPYRADTLSKLAVQDETRSLVHPFLYPPPALLAMSWTLPLSLEQAYRAWYWLSSLFVLAALLALWRWHSSAATGASIALLLASFTPLIDSQVMGQLNAPVLALLCWGALLTARGRANTGGALVGAACILKPIPALIVLWWLVSGERRAAISACATAAVLSLLTLPLLSVTEQAVFYLRVLPGFADGGYSGLSVPVLNRANHSIANLWAQLWPGERVLSPAAQIATSLSSLVVVLASVLLLKRRASQPVAADRDARAEVAALRSFGALCALMLLIPVFTFEHHLVFLLPAWIAAAGALADGTLDRRWIAPLLVCYAATAWPLHPLMMFAASSPEPLAWMAREAKSLGLILLAIACVVAARVEVRDSGANSARGAG